MNSNLNDLEKILNYSFQNRELLIQALTHSSRANETSGNPADGNERLEFLGDAVLEEIVSSSLFYSLPDYPEGKLTKLRASIVCEKSLAAASKSRGINEFMLLGKGEEMGGGRQRDSVVSDCLEAIFGAVFIDGGRDAARDVIKHVMYQTARDAVAGKLDKDSKTELQEKLQAGGITDIEYRITGESGPAHCREFEAAVFAHGKELGRGKGKSKHAAQIMAAVQALKVIDSESFEVTDVL